MFSVVELFSGIGSQARALRNIRDDVDITGTCEWDLHAFTAYDTIHHGNGRILPEIQKLDRESLLDHLDNYSLSGDGKTPLHPLVLKSFQTELLRRILSAILRSKNFVDICSLHGKELPEKIDLLTYSFPCQDLSAVGAFHGYNKGIDRSSGSRSSLLWQVERILQERHDEGMSMPKFLLMENVTTLLNERHFNNFQEWIHSLTRLGYTSKYFQLNATLFGLPQNRLRLLMLSVFTGRDSCREKAIKLFFSKVNDADIVFDYRQSPFYRKQTILSLLRINYDDKMLLQEALECNPNDTPSRQKIWDENPQILLSGNIINPAISAVATLTTKQDRNPNSGNLHFESPIAGRSKFRYLTPRECFLFMGFADKDYECLQSNNMVFQDGGKLFSRDKLIRMAGNSIPVKMLEGIFLQMGKIERLLG